MKSIRSTRLALVLAALLGAAALPSLTFAQQHNERSGTITVQNEVERRLFPLLACVCGGCPHEPLSSCTCGYADQYREQIRDMIAKGMTDDQIKAEWVKRHGYDALTVPSNAGAGQLIYVAPLLAIIGMAGVVIVALKRFRRREEIHEKSLANEGEAASEAKADKRDEYDLKLDEELKQLDDE